MSLRIALLTGRPSGACGVADYSARLADALERSGAAVTLVTRERWDLRAVRDVRRSLRRLRPDVVHLQYPTADYRTSLAPHLLALAAQPLVVTLHEASLAHALRKVTLPALLVRARAVVFTSTPERDHVVGRAPWVGSRSTVIPIASNIPIADPFPPREPRVAFFGLLTPEKGLDDVLELARLARRRPGTRVLVVGRPERRYPDLPARLREQASGLPVDIALDRDAEEVAHLLAASAVGYLPFPDGASARRGSLLALLVNGVPTITTPGPFVDAELDAAVTLADDASSAWGAIERLLDDDAARATAAEAARRYGAARDWAEIAARHVALYGRVRRGADGSGRSQADAPDAPDVMSRS